MAKKSLVDESTGSVPSLFAPTDPREQALEPDYLPETLAGGVGTFSRLRSLMGRAAPTGESMVNALNPAVHRMQNNMALPEEVAGLRSAVDKLGSNQISSHLDNFRKSSLGQNNTELVDKLQNSAIDPSEYAELFRRIKSLGGR